MLNGLFFISGLRGLIGRANKPSSFSSSRSSVLVAFPAGAVPLPTIASREAIPPLGGAWPVAGGEIAVIDAAAFAVLASLAAIGEREWSELHQYLDESWGPAHLDLQQPVLQGSLRA
jgi:hypothetical protein